MVILVEFMVKFRGLVRRKSPEKSLIIKNGITASKNILEEVGKSVKKVRNIGLFGPGFCRKILCPSAPPPRPPSPATQGRGEDWQG